MGSITTTWTDTVGSHVGSGTPPTGSNVPPMAGTPADTIVWLRDRVGSESAGPLRRSGAPSDDPFTSDGPVPSDPLASLRVPCLQDIASPSGGHAGLVRAAVPAGRAPVWVQDAVARMEFGSLHARGLAPALDPAGLIAVRVRRPVDALWAMEEALRAGLPVVGEIAGDPRTLDFTATRRLEMRARAAGVPCLLVRVGPRIGGGSSGARCRWRVRSHPSAPDPYDARAPGTPRWVLELVRARDRPPGAWIIEAAEGTAEAVGNTAGEGGASHRLRVVAALADGGVAAGDASACGAPAGERGGTVVPLRRGARVA